MRLAESTFFTPLRALLDDTNLATSWPNVSSLRCINASTDASNGVNCIDLLTSGATTGSFN